MSLPPDLATKQTLWHRLSVPSLLSAIVLGLAASSAQAQLVTIADATITQTRREVIERTLTANGETVDLPPADGDESKPVKSKTKLIKSALSNLPSYGPPTIEFETLDGQDASAAFGSAGEDRWILIKPGAYRVVALAVERDTFRIKREKYTVQSDGVPAPDQEPDAQVGDNLQVLVIYETQDLTRQRYVSDIIGSQVVRNYLRAKAKKPDGAENWRFFDQHTTFTNCVPGGFCELMKKPRESLPWVIIRNDKTTFEGPLPGDVTKFLALLRSYGG